MLALHYVSVPTWLGRSHKAEEVSPQTTRRYDGEQAQAIAQMLVKGLRRAFARLQPKAGRKSAWSDYMSGCNREQASFGARAEGRFEVALMLAVVHHFTVTDGVPLPDVFDLIASLVTKGIIVEYVPPEDPMFQKLIRNKEHLIPRLGQAQFEAGFAPWFIEQRRLALPQSGRVMYQLAKRS